jgi:hypothetical protein
MGLDFDNSIYTFPAVIILQYPQRRPDHVVKLAAVRHSKKHPDRDEHKKDAQRDQQIEGFHIMAL